LDELSQEVQVVKSSVGLAPLGVAKLVIASVGSQRYIDYNIFVHHHH
jgi:hypothetical protein